MRTDGLELAHQAHDVRITRDDAIHVENRFRQLRVHQRAAERMRIEKMIHVVAGVPGICPGLAQFRESVGTEGTEQQQAAGFEHARQFTEYRVEIVAPLQQQVAEHQVEDTGAERQRVRVRAHALEAAQPARLVAGPLQHAGRDIRRDDHGLGKAAFQRARAVPGAGTEIEDGLRVHDEFIEPRNKLAAHPILQGGGRIVAGAGAVEGARHGATVQLEHLARIRQVHAPITDARADNKASTCASSWAADSVMRRRAVPAGTVGGRIAVTRKPRASSARLADNARCASPTITGTMVVSGGECRDNSPADAPSETSPRRNRRDRASAFSRRHDSRWLTRNAARVAAATAGGNAVV